MSSMWAGVAVGLAGGAGAALVVHGIGAGPVRLTDRIAPFVGEPAPRRAHRTGGGSFATARRLATPMLTDVVRLADRWLGGVGSLRRRIERAGRTTTVEDFRIEQLVWGASGLLSGLLLSAVLLAGASPPPVGALVVLSLGLGVFGLLARDRWLSREVARREERMLAEFPTIADLLALAVTAGEGGQAALERVCRVSGGELAQELSRALGDARTGVPLTTALEGVSSRTGLPILGRFVDGIVVALERGTPLADVLRAQAVDVRAAGQRRLLEAGGRREIAMLVPVVFLLLPTTLLFALYPGFYGFQVLAP